MFLHNFWKYFIQFVSAIIKICNLGRKGSLEGNHIVTVGFEDPGNLGVDTEIRIIKASKAGISQEKRRPFWKYANYSKRSSPFMLNFFSWTSPKVLEQIKKVKQTVAICSK